MKNKNVTLQVFCTTIIKENDFVIILLLNHIMVCFRYLLMNQEIYLFNKARKDKVIQLARS